MDDWQGCLSPQCQTALQAARADVLERGGAAITAEDFLLALIDGDTSVARFLRRHGVDLDELTRTIQCEQPIVTGVNGEDLLSSQLRYWLSLAREISGQAWVDWPALLQTLVHSAERLAGKAYVAVLEQVACWPDTGEGHNPPASSADQGAYRPTVMAEPALVKLAEDVAVFVAAEPRALVWVTGPSGSGKTTWLQALVRALPGDSVSLDLRVPLENAALDRTNTAREAGLAIAPLLILDNTSPDDLLALMAHDQGRIQGLLGSHDGPILMLSPETGHSGVQRLEQILGRSVAPRAMPLTGLAQNLAVLTAHQPDIEKRWAVEVHNDALQYAGSMSACAGMTPGEALGWLKRTAARVALTAERGSPQSQSLAGEADTVRRQLLVACARQQSVAQLEQTLDRLAVESAAVDVDWHERKATGTLRQVLPEDLDYEREAGLGNVEPTLDTEAVVFRTAGRRRGAS
ncbi:MAG: hypothetical protein KGY54_13715 [Oleiphilaceae bacterium]|nr:hypothetical protein [Oleiphilaceae bacterium]